MRAIETKDRDLLRGILARDPIGAIYMLGDLEDRAFSHCRWWVAGDRAVLLLYTGLAVPVVLPFGPVDTLRVLVSEVELPAHCYIKLDYSQRELFGQWRLESPDELYVMGLAELKDVDALDGLSFALIPDARLIEPLYSDYPGNYFDPSQVPLGVYAAAYLDGNIVAAAGTHAYAPQEGAAALGNIVTAAKYRELGIARRLVHYLCEALRARAVRHIGLHVARSNTAAVACYRNVGFHIHSAITQYTAAR